MTIVRWSLDHDGQPTSGGDRPHVGVTVTLAELEARLPGWLTTGDPVSAATIERMLCDADTALTVFGHTGEVLYHGRDQRTAPPGLRHALTARDTGCTHPGCDAPPWWCDAHHIRPWNDGGATDLPNLTLRCRRHHILAHKGDDWRMVMIHGIPHTIARPGSTRPRHPGATPHTTHPE